MSEKFESREEGEDVVDLLSSLTRELAENQGDQNLAQMAKITKDLWQNGEHAAAFWILEAFKKGQDSAIKSLNKADEGSKVYGEVVNDLSQDSGLRSKFGKITFEMGKSE